MPRRKATKAPRRKAAPRRRRALGSTAAEHTQDARNWQRSARDNYERIIKHQQHDPCGAIEHLTDVIAEGTVAEVQFHQAGDKAGVAFARTFVKTATAKQRDEIRRCITHFRPR